ncbi:MAG: hypothetical protein GC203_09895 [Phenylobacterium sp.]|uniref:hypothetical protein n=1 Tax=Phenylobacterium sp. TaxID=1871053 RepID=UPI0025CF861E|nr:hypothetical protein [Phenylobacterium sp.]MBI1198162.1 hypothetical protein [Phenylobacterium sp.]
MSEYLNTEELVAAYPALFSVSMLKKSRMKYADVAGPPHINLGRKVVYDRSDVEAWLLGLKRVVQKSAAVAPVVKLRRGRPTKADQIARRAAY